MGVDCGHMVAGWAMWNRRSRTRYKALVSSYQFLCDCGQVSSLSTCSLPSPVLDMTQQPHPWDEGTPRWGEVCHLSQHRGLNVCCFFFLSFPSFFLWFVVVDVSDSLSCTLSLLIVNLSLVFVPLWRQVRPRPAAQLS